MLCCAVPVQVGLPASVLGSHRCGRGGGEQGAAGREPQQIHLLPRELHPGQPSLPSSSGGREAVPETGPPQGMGHKDCPPFSLQSLSIQLLPGLFGAGPDSKPVFCVSTASVPAMGPKNWSDCGIYNPGALQ